MASSFRNRRCSDSFPRKLASSCAGFIHCMPHWRLSTTARATAFSAAMQQQFISQRRLPFHDTKCRV
ncbi:hypothetical protein ebA4475 [Aromatoleum aromaticum EbN1]|uniref:Uncharacterized protein n=1 Tax=Aromatoleum aromaticum (strain DSM 19018 / LMG 30748 / EbN1) TaxID=76114 RepID=Q5P204_AROAE|nr:hypothetical protein ebA4475 [Aromatoleum aromaticum EbN1]